MTDFFFMLSYGFGQAYAALALIFRGIPHPATEMNNAD